jgi:hypothetical protein
MDSLALHLNAGQLADYDRLFPVNLEHFSSRGSAR